MEIDNEQEQTIFTDEYRLWKKNTPFLYDTLLTSGLEWPSLTCQWFPDVERRPDKNYRTQRLLLGTHTNNEEPNYLQIASVQLPVDQKEIDIRKYEEFTNEIGGYGGYNEAHIKITQKIVHDGEVNRARYMYENPNVIATKSGTGEVCVFDRTTHGSFPKENEKASPALRLQGHTKEGYGLSWNPNKSQSNHLLSAGFDSLICQWDIGAGSKTNRELEPLRIYRGHSTGVEDVAWHMHHPSIFASAGNDRQLMIWDSRKEGSDSALHNVRAHDAEVNCVAFNPGSEWALATGSSDKTAALWDLRNLKVKMHTLRSHTAEVYQLAWSPHTPTILATSSDDRRILVWDLARMGADQLPADAENGPPELLFVHGGHVGRITDFGWDPVEPWTIASSGEENMIQVWQIASTVYGQKKDKA